MKIVDDMQTPLPPLKKSRVHFLVEIVAQCSETNKNSILEILGFRDMVDFILKIRRNSSKEKKYIKKGKKNYARRVQPS